APFCQPHARSEIYMYENPEHADTKPVNDDVRPGHPQTRVKRIAKLSKRTHIRLPSRLHPPVPPTPAIFKIFPEKSTMQPRTRTILTLPCTVSVSFGLSVTK
ncbi:unnamed protein product, partial [Laminaria digitata]